MPSRLIMQEKELFLMQNFMYIESKNVNQNVPK